MAEARRSFTRLSPHRSRRGQARSRSEALLARLTQGESGERLLQDWLDRSRLAYLFLDQTPLTIPAHHRASIKRPDFLVAGDALATTAVDAKAKALVDGRFVLDASERRRLDGFESMFGIPVWYACFPPAEPGLCYLFRNRDLMGRGVLHSGDQQIIHAPLALGFAVEHARLPFAPALRAASLRQQIQLASNV